jgi:hypothetical protein
MRQRCGKHVGCDVSGKTVREIAIALKVHIAAALALSEKHALPTGSGGGGKTAIRVGSAGLSR